MVESITVESHTSASSLPRVKILPVRDWGPSVRDGPAGLEVRRPAHAQELVVWNDRGPAALWERNWRDPLGGRYQLGCNEGRVGQEAVPSSTSDPDGRVCPSHTKHVNNTQSQHESRHQTWRRHVRSPFEIHGPNKPAAELHRSRGPPVDSGISLHQHGQVDRLREGQIVVRTAFPRADPKHASATGTCDCIRARLRRHFCPFLLISYLLT